MVAPRAAAAAAVPVLHSLQALVLRRVLERRIKIPRITSAPAAAVVVVVVAAAAAAAAAAVARPGKRFALSHQRGVCPSENIFGQRKPESPIGSLFDSLELRRLNWGIHNNQRTCGFYESQTSVGERLETVSS